MILLYGLERAKIVFNLKQKNITKMNYSNEHKQNNYTFTREFLGLYISFFSDILLTFELQTFQFGTFDLLVFLVFSVVVE